MQENKGVASQNSDLDLNNKRKLQNSADCERTPCAKAICYNHQTRQRKDFQNNGSTQKTEVRLLSI